MTDPIIDETSEEVTPLEVKITNPPEKPDKPYTYPNTQDQEYDCEAITEKQIEEFLEEENA